EPLPFCARAKQHRGHARRHPETVSRYVAGQKLHRIVNREPRGDNTAAGIDVDTNVFLRIFHLQKEQLRDHEIGNVIVDRLSNEDDAVFEQSRINIVTTLAAAGLFDYHRHEDRLGSISVGLAHFFSVSEIGWTLTFAFRKSRALPSRICSAIALSPSCSSSSLRILSAAML